MDNYQWRFLLKIKLLSGKLTWQWKSTFPNRKYIYKWWIHCYVSLPECIRTFHFHQFHLALWLFDTAGGHRELFLLQGFADACRPAHPFKIQYVYMHINDEMSNMNKCATYVYIYIHISISVWFSLTKTYTLYIHVYIYND